MGKRIMPTWWPIQGQETWNCLARGALVERCAQELRREYSDRAGKFLDFSPHLARAVLTIARQAHMEEAARRVEVMKVPEFAGDDGFQKGYRLGKNDMCDEAVAALSALGRTRHDPR